MIRRYAITPPLATQPGDTFDLTGGVLEQRRNGALVAFRDLRTQTPTPVTGPEVIGGTITTFYLEIPEVAAVTVDHAEINANGSINVVFADGTGRLFSDRAVLAAARDHKSAIDDVYARAVSASAWADARTDGPPHLLQSGNSANPDDMLNFNSFVSALLDIIDGVGTDATNAANLRSAWGVLVDACVRPVL